MDALKKYKICPMCGRKNSPKSLVCSNEECEYDGLMGVSIVDEALEEQQKVLEEQKPKVSSKMIRICTECGHHNPSTLRKCEECGEEINDILPVPEYKKAVNRFIFSSIDDEYAYEVLESSVIIGRENEMKEYLASKMYSSRIQAEVTIVDGKLFVRNLSDKRSTFVNNERVSDTEPRELFDGDELGLGGFAVNDTRQKDAAYFQVRIGNCNE